MSINFKGATTDHKSSLILTKGGNKKTLFNSTNLSANQEEFPIGALAFWKLDDLNDSSGNENTFTNNNGVTFDTGKIGNAAVFQSTRWLGCNMAFNTATSNWSISLWLYPTSAPSNVNTFPIAGPNLGDHFALQLLPDLRVGFGYYAEPDLYGQSNGLNVWTHVVAVCTSGIIELFIDGISVGTSTWTGANDNNEIRLNTNFNDQVFNGKIDAVGLWHRALTQPEITALYNNGNGLEP